MDERHDWPNGAPELPDVKTTISTTNANDSLHGYRQITYRGVGLDPDTGRAFDVEETVSVPDPLKARMAHALERLGRERLSELIYTTDPETLAHRIVMAMDREPVKVEARPLSEVDTKVIEDGYGPHEGGPTCIDCDKPFMHLPTND